MNAKKKFFYLLVSILPLVVSLHQKEPAEKFRLGISTLFRPLLAISDFFRGGVQHISENAAGLFTLNRENLKLKEEVKSLTAISVKSAELTRENERLRSLLNFKESFSYRTIVARVIAREESPWGGWILLDKGTEEGIREDVPIAVKEGLVGKVVAAGRTTSRAILLFNPSSKVSGLVESSRETGLVEGTRGPLLLMKYLDLHSEAKVGDLVLTAGLGGVFPKGIPIGRIEVIQKERDGLTLSALVRPLARFSKLEELLCLAASSGE